MRVCKFRLSNMCISFNTNVCLFHRNIHSRVRKFCLSNVHLFCRDVSLSLTYMYESLQVSFVKYVHLFCHVYMSLSSQHKFRLSNMCIAYRFCHIYICLFHCNICTRVCKFRLSNVCASHSSYICLFWIHICTRVGKFRVSNMYISFVIYMPLLNSHMYESTQVSCVKYVHLCCHTYVSCKATYLHLWFHCDSPQEYASFVRQICTSFVTYICLFCGNIHTSVVWMRVATRVRKFCASNI